ncbi:secretin N-terminal domain-containing protein [Candidatus Omnitrophota bacterium]
MRKLLITTLVIFAFMINPAFAQDEDRAILSGEEKLISIDVKDMEITDVIRLIADQSGLNIVTSKNVQGKVSINLQDVKVQTALDSILKVNNCTYVKEGEVIQIYTLPEYKQREQFSRVVTQVFVLKHIKASDLKPMLVSLKSPNGKVEIEPKTNRVIVTDTEENMLSIEQAIEATDKKMGSRVYTLSYAEPLEVQKNLLQILPETEGEVLVDVRTNSLVITASPLLLDRIDILMRNWDRQIPQVLIEARIMQVTLEEGTLLGVDWQYRSPTTHSITVGVKDLPIPTGVTYVDAFKVGVLDQDDYEITIRALEGLSDVNLISSPRIVTLDNEEAKILIGSSEPYEVLHYDTEGHVTSRELKFIDVGIKLMVTPKIAEDGFITMRIHPEVSSARKGTVTNDLAIDTTEATTIMTVKDGNTVVLGGLIKDDKESYLSKVPFLGDIPLLKYLFRTSYTKNVKREIIIFITPQIIAKQQDLSIEEAEFIIKREQLMSSAMENLAKPK